MHEKYTDKMDRLQITISNQRSRDDIILIPSGTTSVSMRKSPKRRSRKSVNRCRKSLENIKAWEESTECASENTSVCKSAPLSSPDEATTKLAKATPVRKPTKAVNADNDTRLPPAWRDTSDFGKVFSFTRAHSNGLAFSLNLTPRFEAKVEADPSWLLDRIHKALRKHFDGKRDLFLITGCDGGARPRPRCHRMAPWTKSMP